MIREMSTRLYTAHLSDYVRIKYIDKYGTTKGDELNETTTAAT